jgi:hypothetical protein
VLIGLQTRAGHLVAMMLAGPIVVALLGAAARMTEVLGVVPEGALLAVFPRMAADGAQAPALAAIAARRLAAVVRSARRGARGRRDAIVALLFGDAYGRRGAGDRGADLDRAPRGHGERRVPRDRRAAGSERTLLPANLIAAVVGVGLQVVLIRALRLQGAALATVATLAVGQLALLALEPTRAIVAGVWRTVAFRSRCSGSSSSSPHAG